jgi:hypothetical protein
MKILGMIFSALLLITGAAQAMEIRVGASHQAGEKYLGGTDRDLGYIMEDTQEISIKGGARADYTAWNFNLNRHSADLTKDAVETLGLSKESIQESFNIQLSPYFKIIQGHLFVAGGDANPFTGNALYLNFYPLGGKSYNDKIVFGAERDTEKSSLNIVYASTKMANGYLLAGYSSYSQLFSYTKKERTDGRWALAVTMPITPAHFWILGCGEDYYYPSQLIGLSGALGEGNDYIIVWRERIRRSSKEEPMKTQFLLASANFEGYGHYLILPEFFPGLLKTSKVISNKDISEMIARGPGGLLDMPKYSLTVMMLRVELTATSALTVNSWQAFYKFAEQIGVAVKPHVGLIWNEQGDIFFDFIKNQMSDSTAHNADLALGGGVNIWGQLLETQLTYSHNLDRSQSAGIRLDFSTAF